MDLHNITVGTECTMQSGTDRYPYKVVEIFPGKRYFNIQAMSATPGEDHDYYGKQNWEIKENPDGEILRVSQKKDGTYAVVGGYSSNIYVGKASRYNDPHV